MSKLKVLLVVALVLSPYVARAAEAVTVDHFGFEAYVVCADGQQSDHANLAISVPQPFGKWFFSPEPDGLNDPWSFEITMWTPCGAAPNTQVQVGFEVRNITEAGFIVNVNREHKPIHTIVHGDRGETVLPSLDGAKIVIQRKLLKTYTMNSAGDAIQAARKDGTELW